jgi:ATP-dependent Clp protease ATP-binding subunit ClpE
MKLTVSEEVKEKLADLGCNPAFGARPLRRVIQDQLEDRLADFIIDQPSEQSLHAVMENDEIIIKN